MEFLQPKELRQTNKSQIEDINIDHIWYQHSSIMVRNHKYSMKKDSGLPPKGEEHSCPPHVRVHKIGDSEIHTPFSGPPINKIGTLQHSEFDNTQELDEHRCELT